MGEGAVARVARSQVRQRAHPRSIPIGSNASVALGPSKWCACVGVWACVREFAR